MHISGTSPPMRPATYTDMRARIAELEATISAIQAWGTRLDFSHEWYLEGVRRAPGTYVLVRVGEPVADDEHPF